jgi:hypothetical protein
MKRCKRCGRELPFTDFYRNGKGGYSSRCRGCHGLGTRSCVQCGAQFEGRDCATLCSPVCRQARLKPTYKICETCGVTFGPVDRLSPRFCGRACAVRAQTTGRRVIRRTHPRARNAQSLLRYHIQAGHIVPPSACERCGATGRKIEGAHFNYDEPLRVQWLCISCHRRWDKREPKGATYRVPVACVEPTESSGETPTT